MVTKYCEMPHIHAIQLYLENIFIRQIYLDFTCSLADDDQTSSEAETDSDKNYQHRRQSVETCKKTIRLDSDLIVSTMSIPLRDVNKHSGWFLKCNWIPISLSDLGPCLKFTKIPDQWLQKNPFY